MVSASVRARYLRDPWPIRLGGLAVDLARIASCAGNPDNREAVLSILEEGKYFAEWTAPDAPLEAQAALAEVQVSLALWHRRWMSGRREPQMQEQAQRWADRLLALSALMRS